MAIGKRVFITGGQGFLGLNIKSALERQGYFVEAASFDILDFKKLEEELAKQWDIVFHFAGISHIPTCDSDPKKAFEVNLLGTALVVRAIRQHSPNALLIFASSAYVYDTSQVPDLGDVLIDESFPVFDKNVYSTTKLQSEAIIQQANESWGLKSIILRIFNHTHKTQSPLFFLPSVYQQILKAISLKENLIRVGNLGLVRDIGSADDFKNAIVSLCESRHHLNSFEIFNVCSGKGKFLNELVDILCRELNFKGDIIRDESLFRAGEKKFIVGSSERLTQKTGWLPRADSSESLIRTFLA